MFFSVYTSDDFLTCLTPFLESYFHFLFDAFHPLVYGSKLLSLLVIVFENGLLTFFLPSYLNFVANKPLFFTKFQIRKLNLGKTKYFGKHPDCYGLFFWIYILPVYPKLIICKVVFVFLYLKYNIGHLILLSKYK